MSDERFNQLLNGPLSHPFPPFAITRLVLALRSVVEATGTQGDAALEAHCAERDERDSRSAEAHPAGEEGTKESGRRP